jgi:hypothetical protein
LALNIKCKIEFFAPDEELIKGTTQPELREYLSQSISRQTIYRLIQFDKIFYNLPQRLFNGATSLHAIAANDDYYLLLKQIFSQLTLK